MSTHAFNRYDSWTALAAGLVFSEIDPSKLLGFIFVIEPEHKNPKWKIAGGRKEKEDKFNPQLTSSREFEEETGLILQSDTFKHIPKGNEWKTYQDSHWSFLYATRVPLLKIGEIHSNHPRNEGVVPGFFTLKGFAQTKREGMFLRPHIKKVDYILSHFDIKTT